MFAPLATQAQLRRVGVHLRRFLRGGAGRGFYWLTPLLVFLLGCGASILSTAIVARVVRQDATLHFQAKLLQLESQATSQLNAAMDLLRSAAALISIGDGVTAEEWRRFVAQQQSLTRHPALRGVAYVDSIPGDSVAGTRIRDQRLARAMPHFVTRYTYFAERAQPTLRVDGVNYLTRRSQLISALRQRSLAVSTPAPLVGGGSGVVISLPVLIDLPGIAAISQPHARGFVEVLIDTQRLLPDLSSEQGSQLAFELLDGGGSEAQRLLGAPPRFVPGAQREVPLPLSRDREWILKLSASSSYGLDPLDRIAPRATLALGISLTLLLSALVGALAIGRSHALFVLNAEVQKSEQRFKIISEASPLGILVINTAGLCTYTNATYEEISGQSGAAALGPGWLSGVHSGDRSALEQLWQRAAVRHEPFQTEIRFLRADGQIVWANLKAALLAEAGC